MSGDRTVCLRWRETGGPPVTPPERDGFGSVLIRRLVEYDLYGSVEMTDERAGFGCEITFAAAPEDAARLDAQPQAAAAR